MNISKTTFSIFALLFFTFSCSNNKTILDSDFFLNHYNFPEDSLKQKAVAFLLNNMSDQVSEIPIFRKFKLFAYYKIKPDSGAIDNQFLIKDIDNAFQLWNKYPWADRVPFDVFLNYLLPYKIYREEPADWRTFFMQKYQDTICSMLKNLEIDTFYK